MSLTNSNLLLSLQKVRALINHNSEKKKNQRLKEKKKKTQNTISLTKVERDGPSYSKFYIIILKGC